MARAINSTVITMGLVTIPVKVYTAAQSNKVSFCHLTPDLHRVKMQWVDAENGNVVNRRDFKRGFEYSKSTKTNPGKVVEITDDELDSLGPKDPSKAIEIQEFIKKDKLSSISIEKTYYLGPNIGGEKGYALFTKVMAERDLIALAQWTTRGKTHLVAIRPHIDGVSGLVLQQLFYSDELRDFSEVGLSDTIELSQPELDMASQFVDVMTNDNYIANKYKNEYAVQLSELVNRKILGSKDRISSPPMVKTDILDLFSALKESLSSKIKTG